LQQPSVSLSLDGLVEKRKAARVKLYRKAREEGLQRSQRNLRDFGFKADKIASGIAYNSASH
jgi:hypothetical protein